MQFKAWKRSSEHEKAWKGDVVRGGVTSLAKGALLFLSALMVYTAIPANNYLPDLSSRAVKLYVPSELNEEHRRALTLNLGGGDCLWQVRIQ